MFEDHPEEWPLSTPGRALQERLQGRSGAKSFKERYSIDLSARARDRTNGVSVSSPLARQSYFFDADENGANTSRNSENLRSIPAERARTAPKAPESQGSEHRRGLASLEPQSAEPRLKRPSRIIRDANEGLTQSPSPRSVAQSANIPGSRTSERRSDSVVMSSSRKTGERDPPLKTEEEAPAGVGGFAKPEKSSVRAVKAKTHHQIDLERVSQPPEALTALANVANGVPANEAASPKAGTLKTRVGREVRPPASRDLSSMDANAGLRESPGNQHDLTGLSNPKDTTAVSAEAETSTSTKELVEPAPTQIEPSELGSHKTMARRASTKTEVVQERDDPAWDVPRHVAIKLNDRRRNQPTRASKGSKSMTVPTLKVLDSDTDVDTEFPHSRRARRHQSTRGKGARASKANEIETGIDQDVELMDQTPSMGVEESRVRPNRSARSLDTANAAGINGDDRSNAPASTRGHWHITYEEPLKELFDDKVIQCKMCKKTNGAYMFLMTNPAATAARNTRPEGTECIRCRRNKSLHGFIEKHLPKAGGDKEKEKRMLKEFLQSIDTFIRNYVDLLDRLDIDYTLDVIEEARVMIYDNPVFNDLDEQADFPPFIGETIISNGDPGPQTQAGSAPRENNVEPVPRKPKKPQEETENKRIRYQVDQLAEMPSSLAKKFGPDYFSRPALRRNETNMKAAIHTLEAGLAHMKETAETGKEIFKLPRSNYLSSAPGTNT